uniref:Uncharacterized protein n=1 Tax=Opuntia streptacantha TaxID=393608 RepID=A0A7C9DNA1_OPUST
MDAKPRLISYLKAEANSRTGPSGMRTSGILGGVLLMRVEALDHKNSTTRVTIKRWQINVRKLYSNTSKSAHTAVTVARTAAEIFLSLHRRISAGLPPPSTL